MNPLLDWQWPEAISFKKKLIKNQSARAILFEDTFNRRHS